jgi:hypothetical protein
VCSKAHAGDAAYLSVIPRGKYLGWPEAPVADESGHFDRWLACGGWIDRPDLGAALEHDGPLPHPAADRTQ